MKKLMMALTMALLLTASVAMADTSFNAHGSAIVPGMQIANMGGTGLSRAYLYVTNITDSTVTGKLSFYDHDGNAVTGDSNFLQVFNGNTSSTSIVLVASGSESVSFEIPAHCTRYVRISFTSEASKFIFGHAVLEWTSSDERLRKALITRVRYTYQTSSGNMGTSILINNGQPF